MNVFYKKQSQSIKFGERCGQFIGVSHPLSIHLSIQCSWTGPWMVKWAGPSLCISTKGKLPLNQKYKEFSHFWTSDEVSVILAQNITLGCLLIMLLFFCHHEYLPYARCGSVRPLAELNVPIVDAVNSLKSKKDILFAMKACEKIRATVPVVISSLLLIPTVLL